MSGMEIECKFWYPNDIMSYRRGLIKWSQVNGRGCIYASSSLYLDLVVVFIYDYNAL